MKHILLNSVEDTCDQSVLSTQSFFPETFKAYLKAFESRRRPRLFYQEVNAFWFALSKSVLIRKNQANGFMYNHCLADFSKQVIELINRSRHQKVLYHILNAYLGDVTTHRIQQSRLDESVYIPLKVNSAPCDINTMCQFMLTGLMDEGVFDVLIRLSSQEVSVAIVLLDYVKKNFLKLESYGLQQLLLNIKYLYASGDLSALKLFVKELESGHINQEQLLKFAQPQSIEVNEWLSRNLNATFKMMSLYPNNPDLLKLILAGRFFINQGLVDYAERQGPNTKGFIERFSVYLRFLLQIASHIKRNFFCFADWFNFDDSSIVVDPRLQKITVDIALFDEDLTDNLLEKYVAHVAAYLIFDKAPAELLQYLRHAVDFYISKNLDSAALDTAFFDARSILLEHKKAICKLSDRNVRNHIVEALIMVRVMLYKICLSYEGSKKIDSSYDQLVIQHKNPQKLAATLSQLHKASLQVSWLDTALEYVLSNDFQSDVTAILCVFSEIFEKNFLEDIWDQNYKVLENNKYFKGLRDKWQFLKISDQEYDEQSLEIFKNLIAKGWVPFIKDFLNFDSCDILAKKIVNFFKEKCQGNVALFNDYKKFWFRNSLLKKISMFDDCAKAFDVACYMQNFYYNFKFNNIDSYPKEIQGCFKSLLHGGAQSVAYLLNRENLEFFDEFQKLSLEEEQCNPLSMNMNCFVDICVEPIIRRVKEFVRGDDVNFESLDLSVLNFTVSIFKIKGDRNSDFGRDISSYSIGNSLDLMFKSKLQLVDEIYSNDVFTQNLIMALAATDTAIGFLCAGLIAEKRLGRSNKCSSGNSERLLPLSGASLSPEERAIRIKVVLDQEACDITAADGESYVPCEAGLETAHSYYQQAMQRFGNEGDRIIFHIKKAEAMVTLAQGRQPHEDQAKVLDFSTMSLQRLFPSGKKRHKNKAPQPCANGSPALFNEQRVSTTKSFTRAGNGIVHS